MWMVTAIECWDDWVVGGTSLGVKLSVPKGSTGYMPIFDALEDAEIYRRGKNNPNHYEIIPIKEEVE